MRQAVRYRRQSNRKNPPRLVRGAVRLARAINRWFDDGELLPKRAERAAAWMLGMYFFACVLIWTAVYFQNQINVFSNR